MLLITLNRHNYFIIFLSYTNVNLYHINSQTHRNYSYLVANYPLIKCNYNFFTNGSYFVYARTTILIYYFKHIHSIVVIKRQKCICNYDISICFYCILSEVLIPIQYILEYLSSICSFIVFLSEAP